MYVWSLFHSVVCLGHNQPGFPEIIYVMQWVSATGPQLYAIAVVNVMLIVIIGRKELKALSPTLQKHDTWLKYIFFIQRCDLSSVKKVFMEVNEAIME